MNWCIALYKSCPLSYYCGNFSTQQEIDCFALYGHHYSMKRLHPIHLILIDSFTWVGIKFGIFAHLRSHFLSSCLLWCLLLNWLILCPGLHMQYCGASQPFSVHLAPCVVLSLTFPINKYPLTLELNNIHTYSRVAISIIKCKH